jgi:rubrerythrin
MTPPTTIADVIQAAIVMEQTGMDFYQALAGASDDPKVRKLCAELALQEANHRRRFETLLRQNCPACRPDPQGMTDLSVKAKEYIQPGPVAVKEVAIGGNLVDALNMAMQMEQQAISFYRQIAGTLTELAQDIQPIIEEETRHLQVLRSLRQ